MTADAAVTVIDDHGTVTMTFITQRYFSSTQVDRRFVTLAAKAERVFLFDVTFVFGVPLSFKT